jgi:hypothetical protein
MGSWGAGPLVNDAAADWECGLDRAVIKAQKKNLPRGAAVEQMANELVRDRYSQHGQPRDHEELRAAAEHVIRESGSYDFPEAFLRELAEAVKEIFLDKEWLRLWHHPVEVRENIAQQRLRLLKLAEVARLMPILAAEEAALRDTRLERVSF